MTGEHEFTEISEDAALASLRASEARFRTLAASTPTAIFECDLQGAIIYANERWCDLVGRGMIGDPAVVDRIHPEDLERIATLWTTDVGADVPEGFDTRCRMVNADGAWHWFDVSVRPVFDGSVLHSYLGALHDVTDLVEAQQQSQRFQSILEATSDLVAIVREDLAIQYVNPSAREAVGLTDDDPLDAIDPAKHFSSDEWTRVIDEASDALDKEQSWGGDTHFRRGDGVETILSHVIVRGADEDGTKWFASLARDITEERVHRAALAADQDRDALTGLLNRSAILTALQDGLERVATTDRCLGLICVDVDQFKLVNDSFGHEAGDELLLDLTERLRHAAGTSARLARFGSDEFVVLLDGMASPAAVHRRAAHILSALTGNVQLSAGVVHASVSIGVIIDDGSGTASDLLRDADATVSLAKSRGRGRIEVFDHRVHDQVVTRLATEMELRTGLDEGQFVLHYQPVIDLKVGGISAVEALVRWNHPRYGLLAPGAFLPVVDESGLAERLGAWVLSEAVRTAAEWRTDGAPLPRVAVNVAADQLNAPGFADEVRGALGAEGLTGERIILEVTEGIVMADPISTASTLSKLRDFGARVAIDDFGTGYSSLSHLTRLPVDVLKVDKSFVQGLGAETGDHEVTATVVGLGHSLGLRVVAEGVETRAQLDAVRDLGCESVQGFYFCQPVCRDEIAQRIADLSWITSD